MKPQDQFDITSLMPADTPIEMLPAWLGCIHWAIGEPGILKAFKADTGLVWRPAGNAIDQMIDDATGATAGFLRAFIQWVNVNVWGPMEGGSDDSGEKTQAAPIRT
jgi:hypothetical protein